MLEWTGKTKRFQNNWNVTWPYRKTPWHWRGSVVKIIWEILLDLRVQNPCLPSVVPQNTFEPGHEKMCLMSYANNKVAGQSAHSRSLISAFVVRCLDSIISLVSISEISSLYLSSIAEQAGLSLTWSQTPEDTFSHDEAHLDYKRYVNLVIQWLENSMHINVYSSTETNMKVSWMDTDRALGRKLCACCVVAN